MVIVERNNYTKTCSNYIRDGMTQSKKDLKWYLTLQQTSLSVRHWAAKNQTNKCISRNVSTLWSL